MKVQTTVRIDDNSLRGAKEVLSQFGISFSTAVEIFCSKITMTQGLPFDISLPKEDFSKYTEFSKETLESIDDIKTGNSVIISKTADELFDNLGI